jgi:mutator protein MutT
MTVRVIRVVAAVVEEGGLYLITQRRAEAVLGGLWEFPGGRVEPGESDEQALARELRERIGVDARIAAKVSERHTVYPDYEVTLALYSASIPEGQLPRRGRVQDFRWIRSADFDAYEFPAADEATMDALLGLRRN